MTDGKELQLVPSMTMSTMLLVETTKAAAKERLERDLIDVDGVKIYPAVLCFYGAYDGKKFDETLKIINTGVYPAFVRIFPSTSKAFKYHPLPKGVVLASGMSVIRHIKYTFKASVAIPQVFIYIYINDKSVLYPIEVQVASSTVKITPRMLHFGDIDVGTSSKQLSMVLKNKGQKNAHFSVDLGRSDLELIVDPMRGVIQSKQKIEMKVEVLGSRQGKFLKEFWVKTEPLQRVWITGNFIVPKLDIEHPLSSSFDLIVIDFPKTYYNVQNNRIVIIKNTSSTNSMFCTVAEYNKNEDVKLERARELNQNLKFFQINPKEGRLLKNHKAVITVTFAPYKVKSFLQKFCIIFVKIMKVNYRDGVVKGKDMDVKTFSSTTISETHQIADTSSTDSIPVPQMEIDIRSAYLRLCLYGEVEEANVKVTPSVIDRSNLNVNEEYRLTFNVKNCSQQLPITFKYEKLACLELEPCTATLGPNSSLDILLILKPHSMGKFIKKINLVLYYTNRDGVVFKVGNAYLHVDYTAHCDPIKIKPMLETKFVMGLTSPYPNPVGKMVANVRYDNADINKVPTQSFVNITNMKERLNEKNHALIAFPNDRPEWFYPWQNETACMTIFAQLPRYNTPYDFTYTHTPWVKMFKDENNQKYTEIMRSQFQKREVGKIDDETSYPTSMSKVMLTNEKIYPCSGPFSNSTEAWPKFISLTPEELMDIDIQPRYVVLGKIAPHILCSDFFEIKNKNPFPVIIHIVALSNSVIVKGKKRQVIQGQNSAKVYFDCFSHGLGKYYVPVYIIVNDFHVFDAVVFADVVPTTVRCKDKEILINAKENVGFLELFNPVNCIIDFAWDVQDKNYTITPMVGHIDSRKSLYCKITFIPTIDAVLRTEMYLLSQSGAKQIVKVTNDQVRTYVKFSTPLIEMKNTPLNIPVSKLLVVRNESEHSLVLFVREPDIEQIRITPTECLVEGKCDVFFTVTALFKAIRSFSCDLEFVMLDGREHVIQVSGNVAFPNLVLEPVSMHIPKIVTNAYQRRIFRINNNCWAPTKIKFLLDNYPDLTVTDKERKKITGQIELGPKDFVELYLEFQPKEPTAYTLYLPYIINDFIGPPLLNNPKSFKIGTYVGPNSSHVNKSIPTLRVTCAAGAPWFNFSPFVLKLTEEKRKKEFHFTNISSVMRKIKFMVGNLKSCFSVKVATCTGLYMVMESSIKVILEPGQTCSLKFKFTSLEFGVFEDDVPFYVNAFFDNCPFNYIRLTGLKHEPIIEAKNRLVSMPSIPVKAVYSRHMQLRMFHHKPDCMIGYKCNHDYFKVEIKIDGELVEVTVTFLPKTECTVSSEILVTCTCGAFCELKIRAECNNCSLLSYRHKMNWWTEDSSRFENIFDQHNQTSQKKIDILNQILEKFVFTQGFFCTYFFKIPTNISKYPHNVYFNKDKRQKKEDRCIHLPIVTMLTNLSSPGIEKHLTDGVTFATLDDREGAAYDYSIYKNVLQYLEDYNVFVRNISPELLLSYDRYVVFKKQLIDEENLSGDEMLPEDKFHFYSKQCWLDLLLKIYKLFHYDRLLRNEPPQTGKLEIDDNYSLEFAKYYSSQIDSFPSTVDECEAKLKLWIEFHFKEQKTKLWPHQSLPDRPIRDLCYDVRDSLPLATLMAAYCPYLADSFQNISFERNNDGSERGGIHHNACLISEAWNRLKLSFKITTTRISEPVNTDMVFLLSYLYLVLPSFYPNQTITIKSHLGKTSSAKVSLRNTGPMAVCYTAVIFLNDNDSFQINVSPLAIPPKSEKYVIVSYTAKQIIKENAVLVLCGETSGQKHAKSLAINLIGIPDILYFTKEFNLKVEMYQCTSRTVEVYSPYAQPYYAQTYFHLFEEGNPPLNMDDFVSVINHPGLPRQLELDGVCAFDEEGMHMLVIKLCFVALGDWVYYIYFINNEVGIFCIKITVQATLSEFVYDTINVRMQTNFDAEAPCICKQRGKNPHCPRVLYADIPFQNKFLINGLRNMIKIYAQADEVQFWETQLVFPKGFHILRTYLENTYNDVLVPFRKVLLPTVSYKTHTDNNNYSVPAIIKFDDCTLEGHYKLMIHWDSAEFPDSQILYILADHGLESRNYLLRFWDRNACTHLKNNYVKMSLGPLHIVKQRNICNAAVIFLHGSGDTGHGVLDWVKFLVGDFSLPHIKFYFPTAPERPYTPNGGDPSTVWFDRYDITPNVPEHDETLNSIGQEMRGFINKIQKDDNIPLDKIIIGGFSMGGALALHTAYRFSPGLAGIFTLSSFLNKDSAVFKQGKAFNTPLFMCHGDRDSMVPISWGEKTFKDLKALESPAEFHVIKNTMHELKKHEILHLLDWIQKIVPEERKSDTSS